MAPELFQKQGVYSFASDIWSLGCVLFEMASGKPPFSSNSLKELITQIMDTPTPRIDSCSKEFNELIAGLLEKDPVKRTSWDLLRIHPCWEESFPELPLPPQPQFDNYLSTRGIFPSKYVQSKLADVRSPTAAAATISKTGSESSKKSDETGTTLVTTGSKMEKRRDIDLMRLSQTVKKNIMKDTHEYNEQESGKGISV